MPNIFREISPIRALYLPIWFLICFQHPVLSQSIWQDLNQLMEANFPNNEPGGALLILKEDSIVFSAGYGLADVETRERINEHTVFNTGSISKTFVAAGILMLAERGQLDLLDPIHQYFDFKHPTVVTDINISHLLSHTSGLPDLRNVTNNREFYLTAQDQENFAPLLACEQLNFIPGSRFQYSNPAYNGLALIIEQVANEKWQDFIKKYIFQKANMANSKITDGAYPDSSVAHAYELNADANVYEEFDYGEFPTFAAAGNGGIWSSIIDLAGYYQALKSGKFLSIPSVRKAQTPWHPENWSAAKSPFVGYGWWRGEQALFSDVIFNKDIIFHTGSQGGFRAYYLDIVDEQLLVVALFNRPVDKSIMRSVLKILQDHVWLNM